MAKSRLTKAQVKHIAQLSQLKLSKSEAIKFASQLSETLKYVEILNHLKTKNIKPTSQVTGLKNIVRKDKPTPSLTQEEALSGASNQYHRFFKVKAIFG